MKLATIVVGLVLAGCASTGYQWEEVSRVHSGMSEAEVTAILGPPFARALDGNVAVLTWNVDHSYGVARTVSFRLFNGKVVERVPSGQ